MSPPFPAPSSTPLQTLGQRLPEWLLIRVTRENGLHPRPVKPEVRSSSETPRDPKHSEARGPRSWALLHRGGGWHAEGKSQPPAMWAASEGQDLSSHLCGAHVEPPHSGCCHAPRPAPQGSAAGEQRQGPQGGLRRVS